MTASQLLLLGYLFIHIYIPRRYGCYYRSRQVRSLELLNITNLTRLQMPTAFEKRRRQIHAVGVPIFRDVEAVPNPWATYSHVLGGRPF